MKTEEKEHLKKLYDSLKDYDKELVGLAITHITALERELADNKKCPHYDEYEWGEPPMDEESNGRLVKEFECNLAKHHFVAVMCEGDMTACNLPEKLYGYIKELEDERRKLQSDLARVRETLQEISKGEGAFSRDPLTHAENCIENMKTMAQQALGEGEK